MIFDMTLATGVIVTPRDTVGLVVTSLIRFFTVSVACELGTVSSWSC